MIEAGSKAPDFTLKDQAGKDVSLSDFQGKTVVLYFYPKANTSGCTTQALGIKDRRSEYDNAGATVIGVSPDEVKAVAKFDKANGLGFTLLADKDTAKRELDRRIRQSTRFAVLVMRDEDKAAAREYFSTPLLFSIHEAKGLEYENIVLYRFVSGYRQEFAEIASGVTRQDLESDTLDYRRARDKSDKSLEVYKFFVNSLYVALTRAVHRCVIVAGCYSTTTRNGASTTESTRSLLNWLVAGAAAVPSRTTLPVLANILLEASKDGLRLSGTDLDIAVSTLVPAGTAVAGVTNSRSVVVSSDHVAACPSMSHERIVSSSALRTMTSAGAATSTSMRRWPSIRVIGSIVMRLDMFVSVLQWMASSRGNTGKRRVMMMLSLIHI